MNVETKGEGAPGSAIQSALVFEQKIHDLCHDELPEQGTGTEAAYDLIANELLLDGSARLNLATFVTTWMPPQAAALMATTADKNMIDKDEYPQTAEIERRCVNILGRLWHAPGSGGVTGTSTTGSSEAAMLGGLALKWRWRKRMSEAGKPTDRPNLVTGANVQVCWEKFCRYWDVEPRLVPLEGDRLHLGAEEAAARCDKNTIGVVAVLGSTFDGSYEPVSEISTALDELAASGGPDVPIHVDGASGGFVAPFVQPDLEWDFRLPRVQSINASGHKYGLVYPGAGWAIWRDKEALPRDLVFDVNYLGGSMPTFALNFSRPGSEVIAQYFMFASLGAAGYRAVQRGSSSVSQHIAREIAEIGPYRLLTDGSDLPVFAFTLAPQVKNYTVFDVSARLREEGWLVPAYTFPENRQDLAVLRVVVRAGMSHDMADLFLAGVRKQTASLEALSVAARALARGDLQLQALTDVRLARRRLGRALANVPGGCHDQAAPEPPSCGRRARVAAPSHDSDSQLGVIVLRHYAEAAYALAHAGTAFGARARGLRLRPRRQRQGHLPIVEIRVAAMLDRGGGAIVNMSSTAGLRGVKGIAGHVAGQHSVIGLTKVAALNYAQQNIRVNAVAPGAVDSHQLTELTDPQRAGIVAGVPIARLGQPEEMIATVTWLCSDEASSISGATITVDGSKLAGGA